MAQVNIDDIVEYQTFRKNPGPLLEQAANGRTLLVVKGRERVVVLDAATYNALVQRAESLTRIEPANVQRTGTQG
jgi:prevent-host-death family protein